MNKPDPRLRPEESLAWQQVSLDVLREKYAKGAERDLDGAEMARAVRLRVARALAAVEADPARREPSSSTALEDGFIPGGRINSAAGSGIRDVTLINCFVQPVGDSVSETVDGKPGIYIALRQAAETMRRGGGVGYDFSAIRPRGAKVHGTDSAASGPISYMHVFDQSCATVESAGARRGAQMGVLRCDHPDIMEFVAAKRQSGRLNNFNISVGVTDALMRAVEADGGFELVHKAEPGAAQIAGGAHRRGDGLWVYATIRARELWSAIMRNTYEARRARRPLPRPHQRREQPPLRRAHRGDQPLRRDPDPRPRLLLPRLDRPHPLRPRRVHAHGGIRCRSLRGDGDDRGAHARQRPLRDGLAAARAGAPRPRAKRRVGLGFTGLGDALIMLGLRYDSDEARAAAAGFAEVMRDAAYRASVALAAREGRLPALRRRALPRLRHGPAPARGNPRRDPRGRHAQQPPALDRPDRHDQPRLRRQRLERHRARLFAGSTPARSARPTARCASTASRTTPGGCGAPAAATRRAAARLRQRPRDRRPRPHAHAGGDPALRRRGDLEDRQRPRGLSLRRLRDPLPRGLARRASRASPPTARTRPRRGALGRKEAPQDLDQTEPDRRIRISDAPQVALAALRWPHRPKLTAGSPSWTYMIEAPGNRFAVFVGHVENGRAATLRGLGQRRADAPRPRARSPRTCRWTCAPRIPPG